MDSMMERLESLPETYYDVTLFHDGEGDGTTVLCYGSFLDVASTMDCIAEGYDTACISVCGRDLAYFGQLTWFEYEVLIDGDGLDEVERELN